MYNTNNSHIACHLWIKDFLNLTRVLIIHITHQLMISSGILYFCIPVFRIPISSIACHWELLNHFRNQSDRKQFVITIEQIYRFFIHVCCLQVLVIMIPSSILNKTIAECLNSLINDLNNVKLKKIIINDFTPLQSIPVG